MVFGALGNGGDEGLRLHYEAVEAFPCWLRFRGEKEIEERGVLWEKTVGS